MNQLRERTARSTRPLPDEVVVDEPQTRRLGTSASLRVLGAIAVLVVGAVHLEQYFGVHFNVVPVIGPLFLLNFIAATVIGLGLLIPQARMRAVHVLLALGGIGLAATSFAFLLISERRPLFGFQDYGYRAAIIIALAAEAAAALLLAAYLTARPRRA
ncbi:MAG TPA: hypothetical protein VGK79_11880 [Gaiellaceae bacterium]|jgi:hypothetical protein